VVPGELHGCRLRRSSWKAVTATAVHRPVAGTVHEAADLPGGLGDIGAAGQAQGADGKVAQSGHDSWSGPRSDLRFVFLVKGVAPVQGLY
jgi:hypothetical protein